MRSCDVLIVGGGPAGSSCARVLAGAGADVVVLDRARFPRDKLCAGWLTPPVFDALALTPAEYAATGAVLQEIDGFATGVIGRPLLETRYGRVVSYGIRRCEFDAFLLRRSGANVRENTAVSGLRRVADGWIVNEGFRAPVLVGAGGHFCPVAGHLGRTARPHTLVVAQETEFLLRDSARCRVSGEVPELFFCRDLDGYGWCFRKGNYLNAGIGRRMTRGFLAHVRAFRTFLEETERIEREPAASWRGHAYVLAGGATRTPVDDRVLLAGDAAGLAVAESGEGIRTAIESGIAAAEVLLAAKGRYTAYELQPYVARVSPQAAPPIRPARVFDRLPAPLVRAAGRRLLRSRAFTRHVVIDRWFLRAHEHAMHEFHRPGYAPPSYEGALSTRCPLPPLQADDSLPPARGVAAPPS
jgi:geranylgeranyl reductase family protein